MEYSSQTQQTLETLRLQNINSPILPLILPLFETIQYNDEYKPNRIYQHKGDAQLLWEIGEPREDHFERMCLTLSKQTLSLTIALDHHHTFSTPDIPTIPRAVQDQAVRSTFVIDSRSHTLFERHRSNATELGKYRGDEASARFSPELTHALAFMGLYGYGQMQHQEVS